MNSSRARLIRNQTLQICVALRKLKDYHKMYRKFKKLYEREKKMPFEAIGR